MIFILALIPATGLTIAGYFVLYLSHRSEGPFRAFGKYLGFWAITLAGLVILGALFAAAHAGRYGGMAGMHGRYMHMYGPWQGDPRFFPENGPPPPGLDSAPNLPPPSEPAPPPPR